MNQAAWKNNCYFKIQRKPRVCHTEGSKSEREKQTPYANTYIWNLKKKKKSSEEPSGRTGMEMQT